MATINKKAVKTKSTKKDIKQEIIQKLEAALIHLKDVLGEKKFNSRIKKASKLFTHHASPEKGKKAKAKPATRKTIPSVKKVKTAKKKAVAEVKPAKKP